MFQVCSILPTFERVVVVVGALRTDCRVHFQQDAGLRLFLQHSFTSMQRKGWDRIGWRTTISTTTTTYHYLYPPTFTEQEVGRFFLEDRSKYGRTSETQSHSHSCWFTSRRVIHTDLLPAQCRSLEYCMHMVNITGWLWGWRSDCGEHSSSQPTHPWGCLRSELVPSFQAN